MENVTQKIRIKKKGLAYYLEKDIQWYIEYLSEIRTYSLGPATTNVRRLGSVKNFPCKTMVYSICIKLKSKYNLFLRLSPQTHVAYVSLL